MEQGSSPLWPPSPSLERQADRFAMVNAQLESPHDRREVVSSPSVISAMLAVPRHRFVPPHLTQDAYADRPLPIGEGQTISQPYIVGRMLELLDVKPHHRVLDVGTGSGYQAALLYHLTPHVFSIEVVPELHDLAASTLHSLGYDGIELRLGDANQGWSTHQPYDRIVVACAATSVPEPLWEQLAPRGKMILPLKESSERQALVMVEKTEAGKRRTRRLTGVSFVPFISPEAAAKLSH